MRRVIIERQADFPDRRIDRALCIEVDTFAPELFGNFLTRNEFSWPPGQHQQQLQGDPFEFQVLTGAPQSIAARVQVEVFETDGVHTSETPFYSRYRFLQILSIACEPRGGNTWSVRGGHECKFELGLGF